MLLSNSNSNGSDPISSLDHPFLQSPFLDDEDHLHLPISSFLFPSPFEDDDVSLPPHQELFLHHLQQSTNSIPKTLPSLSNTNQKVAQSSPKDHQLQRRRSSDRHSKINTLRGPRDRRMRLSLQVARDLFGLQDMLGVDKASKTVEWLLIQSKPAIQKLEKELFGSELRRSSSLSECDIVSGIHEDHAIEGNQPVVKQEKQNVRTKQTKKLAFHPSTKESREKARARARARTEKKKQIGRLIAIIGDDPNRHNEKSSCDFTRIGSSVSPLGTGEESGGTQGNVMNPCLDVLAEIDEPASSHSVPQKLDQTVDDSSIMTDNWSPSSIFSSLHSNEIYPQEYEFEELPFIGESWSFYLTSGFPLQE